MMGIVVPETCSAYKKYNKIISDIQLVFHSSVITMMHGPINIRLCKSSLQLVLVYKYLIFLDPY